MCMLDRFENVSLNFTSLHLLYLKRIMNIDNAKIIFIWDYQLNNKCYFFKKTKHINTNHFEKSFEEIYLKKHVYSTTCKLHNYICSRFTSSTILKVCAIHREEVTKHTNYLQVILKLPKSRTHD